MVSYRRALRPVWVAAVCGAAVITFTVSAMAAPKPVLPIYTGADLQIVYGGNGDSDSYEMPRSLFGFPLAITPQEVASKIRATPVIGQPTCRTDARQDNSAPQLHDVIDAFTVCVPVWYGSRPAHEKATIGRQSSPQDYRLLFLAMIQPDRFRKQACVPMKYPTPTVYTHTKTGWWLVRQPLSGCYPDPQDVMNFVTSREPANDFPSYQPPGAIQPRSGGAQPVDQVWHPSAYPARPMAVSETS